MDNEYLLYKNINELDLHGKNRYESKVLIEEFILENVKMKKRYVYIIYGKGEGILKQATFDLLKHNKYVLFYKQDINNDGRAIVELKR